MKKNLLPLKVVAAMAMLSAISIVAGKYLAIPGGDVMRFSFENLPIILAGAAFGPLAGALVGAVADLIGCVLVGFPINPVVTVGAVSIGAVSGLVYLLLKKVRLPIFPRVIISVFSAHLIGSVVITPFITPFIRSLRVRARVSISKRPMALNFLRYWSILSLARKLEGEEHHSLTI